MMDNKDIFALTLNLSAPWKVTEITLTKPQGLQRGPLDIYIEFGSGFQFVDDQGLLGSADDST